MSITDRQWVARHLELLTAEIPASYQAVIGRLVADTIAVSSYARRAGIGGTAFDATGLATADQGSLVWGGDTRAAPLDAAFLNGSAAEALDFQEVLINGRNNGHAAVVIVPAVLALAEQRKSSSDSVARALWIAFAANIGLAETLGRAHRANGLGFRTTSLTAPLAAALGCATLLDTSVDTALSALGICASTLPAGLLSAMSPKMGSYSPDKDLSVGFSARHALHCALLAGAGATGPEQPITGDKGWLASFGAGSGDISFLATPPMQHDLTAYSIKLYPANFGCQSAIRAAIELGRDIAPDQITRLHVEVKSSSASSLSTRSIDNHLAARFSLPYAVASAFVRGRSVLADFEGEAVHDTAVLAFMDKIELTGSDELETLHLSKGVFPAKVTAYRDAEIISRAAYNGPFDGFDAAQDNAAFVAKLQFLCPPDQVTRLATYSQNPVAADQLQLLFH
jgi:2-methylcitrate dehydratase PrpD